MEKIRLGLLPLYIELYDRTSPAGRSKVEAVYEKAVNYLRGLGLDIITSPVCRLKGEFAEALNMFKEKGASGLLTLHLAYSPSLESIDSICASPLPVLVVDITDAYSFGSNQLIGEVSLNHGIHGVQDLCCMMTRKGKPYDIIAGHMYSKRAAEKILSWSKAVSCAAALGNAKVGIVGKPFNGMGDFQVPYAVLKKQFGFSVVEYDPAEGQRSLESLNEAELLEELSLLKSTFDSSTVNDEYLKKTARTNLVIKKWIDREKLNAMSINFLDIKHGMGLEMMPFTEASIAMSNGIGYAGEGDVLTAALMRALVSSNRNVSFTEMFCPDWEGGSIYMSHMGEMNISLTVDEPCLFHKPFIYTDIGDSVSPYGVFMPGKAMIVNLAPSKDNSFRLILCKGEMLPVCGRDNMNERPHGWFKPEKALDIFLEEYSRLGGTHHSVLVYGDTETELEYFGRMIGCDVFII